MFILSLRGEKDVYMSKKLVSLRSLDGQTKEQLVQQIMGDYWAYIIRELHKEMLFGLVMQDSNYCLYLINNSSMEMDIKMSRFATLSSTRTGINKINLGTLPPYTYAMFEDGEIESFEQACVYEIPIKYGAHYFSFRTKLTRNTLESNDNSESIMLPLINKKGFKLELTDTSNKRVSDTQKKI